MNDFRLRCPWDEVERVPAVDANQLVAVFREDTDLLRKLEYLVKSRNKNLVYPGVIGCALSHYKLWKMIGNLTDASDNDKFFIMEDDACFSDAISYRWPDLEPHVVSEDFDILYLGGRFEQDFEPANLDNWKHMYGSIYRRSNHFSSVENSKRFDFDRTTHGYVISKSCCRFLIENSKDLLSMPVDHWIVRTLLNTDRVCLDNFPHLLYSPRHGGDSDIRQREKTHMKHVYIQSRYGPIHYKAYLAANHIKNYLGRKT